MNKSTIDKAEQEGIKQGIWLCIQKTGTYRAIWYGEMFYRVIRI